MVRHSFQSVITKIMIQDLEGKLTMQLLGFFRLEKQLEILYNFIFLTGNYQLRNVIDTQHGL